MAHTAFYTACVLGLLLIRPAHADTCSCVDQVTGNTTSTTQSGRSICATAKTAGRCAVYAAQGGADVPDTTPHIAGFDELKTLLTAAGINIDPEDALRTARRIPPERWNKRQFETVLTVLLALPRAGMSAEQIREIYEFLGLHSADLLPSFAAPDWQERSIEFDLGGYAVTESYGCLRIARGAFVGVARLPFAGAGSASGLCGALR
jgi:hypothetical protein